MDVTKTLNKINVNYIVLLTLSTMWDSEVLPHTLPPPIHHTQSKSGDSFQTKRFLSWHWYKDEVWILPIAQELQWAKWDSII